MNKTIYAFASIVLSFLVAAVLTTFGIFNNNSTFYVFALWVFFFPVLLLAFSFFRHYQRLLSRIERVDRRLAKIEYLLERRYEQLARRLDDMPPQISKGRGGRGTGPETMESVLGNQASGQLSELEYLNARLQQLERRILGRLENTLLDNDTRIRNLDRHLSDIKKAIRP